MNWLDKASLFSKSFFYIFADWFRMSCKKLDMEWHFCFFV
jgi:hypothetical protein